MWARYGFPTAVVILYALVSIFYFWDTPSPEISYKLVNLTRHDDWNKPRFLQIMLRALKKVGIARRYERNIDTSANLQMILSRLKRKVQTWNSKNTPNINVFTEKVTLVLNFATEINVTRFDTIINGIGKSRYKDVRVVIAIEKKKIISSSNAVGPLSHAVIVHVDNTTSHSQILIRLLSHVKTEFVVICRNIVNFNNYVSLEKLMHPLFHKYCEFIGAAHRNIFGHWELGCLQTNMLWYRYRLVKGFDLSNKNYVYCDYLGGPFAAKTGLLKQQMQKVSMNLQGDALYLDLMINLKLMNTIIMSCIDCVFNVESFGMENIVKLHWQPFAIKYKINLIIFASNNTVYFSCNEMKADRSRSNGRFITYCHHKEMTDAAIFTAKICDKAGIEYELNAGTVLGSVKLRNTLYWELDHDFKVRVNDFDKLMSLRSVFSAAGYSFATLEGKRANCHSSLHCRYVHIRTRHFFLEMFGMNLLSSDVYGNNLDKILQRVTGNNINFKIAPTSVRGNRTLSRIGNAWIPTMSSPGGYSRGIYGVDILQHVQHWRDLKVKAKGGLPIYKPKIARKFTKCNKPGFHGCSELFLADGNLQFITVWV